MHPGLAITIVFVTAILTIGAVLKTLIDARHRRSGSQDELGAGRQIELLSSENASLKDQVSRLEERIAVLERIVTDEGRRLAHEIEALHLPRN